MHADRAASPTSDGRCSPPHSRPTILRRITDASARGFRAFADSTGADRYALAAIQRAATPIAKTRLDAINVPTMVIAGDRDDLAGSPQELADRIPGAIARVIKGTHLGAVADPAFPASIVEFVTTVASV